MFKSVHFVHVMCKNTQINKKKMLTFHFYRKQWKLLKDVKIWETYGYFLLLNDIAEKF